ncbi:hypothetical protein AKO1_009340 [Acrasis kona]|uniref:Uncharacterized protein n=1 Tax=Acrasis kona TaxID=1008807 RepID=A0AAW2ZKK7_9EUKA
MTNSSRTKNSASKQHTNKILDKINTTKPSNLKRPIVEEKQKVNFLFPNRQPPSTYNYNTVRQPPFFGVRVGAPHRRDQVSISNGQISYRRGNSNRPASVVNHLPQMVRNVLYSGKHRIQFGSPVSSNSWFQWARDFSTMGYVQQSFRCSVMANHLRAPSKRDQPIKRSQQSQRYRTEVNKNHIDPHSLSNLENEIRTRQPPTSQLRGRL